MKKDECRVQNEKQKISLIFLRSAFCILTSAFLLPRGACLGWRMGMLGKEQCRGESRKGSFPNNLHRMYSFQISERGSGGGSPWSAISLNKHADKHITVMCQFGSYDS